MQFIITQFFYPVTSSLLRLNLIFRVLVSSTHNLCEMWGSHGGIKVVVFSDLMPCNQIDWCRLFLPSYTTLKFKAASCYEMVHICKITWCHTPEDVFLTLNLRSSLNASDQFSLPHRTSDIVDNLWFDIFLHGIRNMRQGKLAPDAVIQGAKLKL